MPPFLARGTVVRYEDSSKYREGVSESIHAAEVFFRLPGTFPWWGIEEQGPNHRNVAACEMKQSLNGTLQCLYIRINVCDACPLGAKAVAQRQSGTSR
jgi:hypothetical protein